MGWDSGGVAEIRSLVKENQEQQKKPFVGVCCGRKKKKRCDQAAGG